MTGPFSSRARRVLLAGAMSALVAGTAAGPAFAGNKFALAAPATATVAVSTGNSATSSSSTSVSTSNGTQSTSSSTTTTSTGTSGAAGSAANCTMPALSEPFAAWSDTNEYALVPGQAFDSFTATGWTLSGGASIETTTLQDGTSGSVLNLPAGSEAVSPEMCVDYDFPDARMMVRNATGVQDLNFLSSYAGSGTEVNDGYSVTGQGTGWTPSPILQTDPGSSSGWQLVVFTIQVPATATDTQVYNVYVDPRMTS